MHVKSPFYRIHHRAIIIACGRTDVMLHISLTWGLMKVSGQLHALGRFTAVKFAAFTYWIGERGGGPYGRSRRFGGKGF